ncbi:MAG: hypothetical protein WB579_10080 [Bryobacteraceae bacterium]
MPCPNANVRLVEGELTRCVQPLHRFHRLPGYFEPPAYLNTILAAQEFYEDCLDVGVTALGFPKAIKPFQSLALALDPGGPSKARDAQS